MARILVTGGAGFIGSHLVDALLARGDHVTVLDDLSTGSESNLAGQAGKDELSVRIGSVLDAGLVGELVDGVEVVYHLAAAVGVRNIIGDPVSSILTNVQGTENVLAAAAQRQRRILIASTSEVYGKNATPPFAEATDRVLGPTWVPRWSYSTAKAIDEHLAFAYAQRGLPVSIVRYFNSYGPRIDERGYGSVIARFAAQALAGEPMTVHGDGKQTRCFTFVRDTVRGTIMAATDPRAIGRVINIGAHAEITIRDVAHLIRDILNSKSRIEFVDYETYYGPGFEDTRRRVPDPTLAREILGFETQVDLRTGLQETLEWCRANYRIATRGS